MHGKDRLGKMRAMADGQAPAPDQRPVLRGWKDIAAYVGVSVRTAQRLSGTDGLPARHAGHTKGGVFALPSEIDAWMTGRAVAGTSASSGGASRAGAITEPAHRVAVLPDALVPGVPPVPSVAATGDDGEGASTRSGRLTVWAVAIGVMAVVFVAGFAAWRSDSAATPPQATPSLQSSAVTAAPRAFRLRVRIGEEPVGDLWIVDGMRGSVVTAASQQLYLEPHFRGRSLHLALYERVPDASSGDQLQLVGTADLVGPLTTGTSPIRFLVEGGWLEVAWVE